MLTTLLRRASLVPAVIGLAVLPARATWSLVVVDRATGEVCVAGATCLKAQLQSLLPAIAPGVGVGAAQSIVDFDGSNLALIQEGLLAGLTPQQILDQLAVVDVGHQGRQYGIVSLYAPPVTFSGANALEAKFGVTGEVGTLAYAIQGNILVGSEVVLAAEAALLATPGDLGQRVMAGMEAARALGGDGRCSCGFSNPTSCGVPPPDFTNSALSSFIVLARPGDEAGPCGQLGGVVGGCTTGSYYLLVKHSGNAAAGPTVIKLQALYAEWRAQMAGITDAYKTSVEFEATPLVADGRSRAQVRLTLADLDGVPLTSGGQEVHVRRLTPEWAPALVGPVRDLGDGTHTFDLLATTHPGRASYRIVVLDGERRVQLPDISIYVAPVTRR